MTAEKQNEKLTSDEHKMKELEQEKILLTKLNNYLTEKVERLEKYNQHMDESHTTKEIEQENLILENLNRYLSEKTELETKEFLEVISHELRTPLVPIKGFTDMLLRDPLSKLTEKQKEKLEIVRLNTSQLLQLITDLLDYKKLLLGEIKMNKLVYDIEKIISDVILKLQDETNIYGTKINFNINKAVFILCDAQRISQVLFNLIKNSLQAVQKDKGEIEIRVEDKPKEIKVIINDNGKGIPAEKMSKVFSGFYQIDMSSTREKGGAGLGLSFCKLVIDAHSGKICVESDIGRRTTVTFTLPK